MTEDQWLTERRQSQGMLWHLRSAGRARTKAGRRKLRLFACGCCRLIWDLLADLLAREAVEVAERFADGNATREELEGAFGKAMRLGWGSNLANAPGVRERTAARMAAETCRGQAFAAAFDVHGYPLPVAGSHLGERDGNAVLCDLLRCVFGNPFRPAALPAVWRTPATRGVARQIYDERCFEEMSVLADALEDAGCDDEAILGHCRGPGPHVRGCWVVDLVLAK